MPNWDEGKVMALASFGKPTYLEDFRKMVIPQEGGDFQIDLSWAGWHLERKPLSRRIHRIASAPLDEPGAPLTQVHEDVAFAIQTISEETALHLAAAAGRAMGHIATPVSQRRGSSQFGDERSPVARGSLRRRLHATCSRARGQLVGSGPARMA